MISRIDSYIRTPTHSVLTVLVRFENSKEVPTHHWIEVLGATHYGMLEPSRRAYRQTESQYALSSRGGQWCCDMGWKLLLAQEYNRVAYTEARHEPNILAYE